MGTEDAGWAGKSEGEDTRIVKGRHQTLYVYELPQIAEGKTPKTMCQPDFVTNSLERAHAAPDPAHRSAAEMLGRGQRWKTEMIEGLLF